MLYIHLLLWFIKTIGFSLFPVIPVQNVHVQFDILKVQFKIVRNSFYFGVFFTNNQR